MHIVFDFGSVHLILSALTGYAWILLIGIVVYHFRQPIREVLGRMTALKSAGIEMTLGIPSSSDAAIRKVEYDTEHVSVQKSSSPDTQRPDAPAISDQGERMSHLNVYHWYWLGHDLMFTQDVLFRGGDGAAEHVLYGIRQSLFHWDALGVISEEVRNRLVLVKDKSERLAKNTWTNDDRREALAVLQSVKLDVGSIASQITGKK